VCPVPRPSRPAPPPLQVDTAKVVLAGTAVWAAALVVLLVLGDRVDPAWTWTCVCGIVLAVLGLALMRWQGQLGPRHGREDDGET
jgi:drug/metabolite transporter (DMT)-like permease